MMSSSSTQHASSRRDVRTEQALIEASHILVSTSNANLDDILRIIAETTSAKCAFIFGHDWDENRYTLRDLISEDILLWHRGNREAREAWIDRHRNAIPEDDSEFVVLPGSPQATLDATEDPSKNGHIKQIVVPILAKHDRFIGYLGIEHTNAAKDIAADYRHTLSLFSDLLAGYFSRIKTEVELRASEERWRSLVEYHPDPIIITLDGRIVYANAASAHALGANSPSQLRKYSMRDFVSAESYDEVCEGWNRQMRTSTPTPFEHELIRLDGNERIVESVATAISYKGQAATQTVFRDITDRRDSERRYSTFVQTISEGIWHLDLLPPISVEAHMDLQLQYIAEQAVLTECNNVMASLWETPQDQLIGQHLYELAGPINSTILDAFLKAGYRLHNHNVSISVDHETTRHFVVNAVGQVNRGALRAIWGSCIEVTDHVEMERRLVAALEEQQERIGHDLHDSVGQLLTGIRILSSNLAENFHQRGDPHAETVQKVAAFASEASEYVRNIYRGLAPPQLFRDGLTVALEELAASTNGIGDITCIFKGDTIEHLSNRDINLQLYRIAQEATNNALKHADASVIEIMLTTEKDYIVLEVTDDGAGFDSNQNYTESLGLYSMQRRASCIQASLDILSRPDYGTTIRVEVPTSG